MSTDDQPTGNAHLDDVEIASRRMAPEVDLARIEAAVAEILEAIGEDTTRDGLAETPARVARLYAEICGGLHVDPAEHVFKTFELDWIAKVREDKPFFAVVWFGSPHGPHIAVDEDRAHYREQSKGVQNFLGEITGMDRAYGRIRKALGEMGVRDNTILWYCSDNGALKKVGSSGGHRGKKGMVYDGGLLVPAILEWPARIPKPRTVTTRCVTSDIFPTLVAAAGVDHTPTRPMDGINLMPLIEGAMTTRSEPIGFWDASRPGISTPSAKWMGELLKAQQAGGDLPPHSSSLKAAELPDPPVSSDRFPGHAAWIEGDWKLHRIEGKQGATKWELYNLGEDPAEERDLLAREGERAKPMEQALEAWLRTVVASLNGEDY